MEACCIYSGVKVGVSDSLCIDKEPKFKESGVDWNTAAAGFSVLWLFRFDGIITGSGPLLGACAGVPLYLQTAALLFLGRLIPVTSPSAYEVCSSCPGFGELRSMDWSFILVRRVFECVTVLCSARRDMLWPAAGAENCFVEFDAFSVMVNPLDLLGMPTP